MEIKNSELRIQNFYRCLLFVSYIFFLASCSFKKEVPVPKNLITEDSMVVIITDVTLAESALNIDPMNEDLKKTSVLKQHHISLAEFDTSFAYYSKNPAQLKDIYERVLVRLNSMQ